MRRVDIKRANSKMIELEELEKYKDFIDKGKKEIHFEFRAHYGDCRDSEIIQIEPRHNTKFIAALMNVIDELNNEIDFCIK